MTPDENRSVANGLATVASSIDLSIIHPQERYKMRQAAVRDYVYNTGSNLTKYINTLTAFLQSVK
jgi:DNA polymerase sigma